MSAAPALLDLMRRHQRALLVAGVALLVVASWGGAVAYHETVETRVHEAVAPWSERAAFTYSVPITRNATPWPLGTRLPMGEPAYFRTVSDSIDVAFTWSATAQQEARGVAAGRLYVQVLAQDDDGRPYWSVEHTLDEQTAEHALDGLALAGRVDLDALVEEVGLLAYRLPPGDGTVNWSVRAHVVYSMETGGRRDTGEAEYALPVLAQDPRFVLPPAEALAWQDTHATQAVHTTHRPAGTTGVLTSLRVLAAGAVGLTLLGMGVAAARTRPGDGYESEYRRFRDWVSPTGGVPEPQGVAIVDVTTLQDLVHVANDARTRVLVDERTRTFYALLPGVTYRYARHQTAPG